MATGPSVRKEVPPTFGRILLAVDGSPPSDKAAQLAAKLAAPGGNEVVVIHVIELVPTRMGPAELELREDAQQLVWNLPTIAHQAHPGQRVVLDHAGRMPLTRRPSVCEAEDSRPR